METQKEERWRLLCEQAAQEQDTNRLLKLVQEINLLLDKSQNKKSSTEAPSE